ncbi:MAG: A/G-specific adenine glycosylase [Acidimicrobiales bacterium]
MLDRWPQFLRRFPTVAACAAAPVGDVIDEWSGLGYNRRAVYLHQAAGVVVAEHGGELPRSLPALLALPGVGPYTAQATSAFAFEADEAVVDTNVGRIFARMTGAKLSTRQAQRLADEAVPAGHGWSWNQALLDLGASICTSRQPACDRCPIASNCSWASVGPDPAIGSAAVSTRQSRFEGSDRQGRGRLVRQLRAAPIAHDALAAATGWPNDRERAEAVADSLVADGIIERRDGWLVLAGW